MKHFLLSALFIFTLLAGAGGFGAELAHAQFCADGSSDCSGESTSAQQDSFVGPPDLRGSGAGAAPAQVAKTGTGDVPQDFNVDKNSGFNSVMQWIMSLFAWLLTAAGVTLDYAVYYTVVNMGGVIDGSGGLTSIGAAWTVLRDFGNIILIFGFLAMGIATILDVEWYGFSKKMIPMLLVSAIFLNFSLFISQAVVDVGNLFATQFYTAIKGNTLSGVSSGNDFLGKNGQLANESISTALMNQLGLQTFYGDTGVNTAIFKGTNQYLIGFMGIIIFMIAAFVFFSLAFILIARFVALIFLIIVAPIGFAGLAVPKLSGLANRWWGALFQQTMVAPALLLLLYVALKVITDSNFLTGFGSGTNGAWTSWTNSPDSLGSLAGAMLSFFIAMGLLLAVMYFAKQMSAFGAGLAMKLGGMASFGVVGFAGRRTVGRAGTAAASRFRNSKYARSNIGRLFAGGLDYAAKGSYDFRGTGALKNLPLGGIDAGKAQEGGYKKIKEEAVKARINYDKTLGLTKGEDEKVKQIDEEISGYEKTIENAKKTMSEEELKAFRKQYDNRMGDLRKEKKDLENSAHKEYAEGMKRWSTIGGPESAIGKILSVPYSLLVGPAANKEASKKILKEAKKEYRRKGT